MPKLTRVGSVARKSAAVAVLALTAYAAWSPFGFWGLMLPVLTPFAWLYVWLGSRLLLFLLSKLRAASPAPNPFETEEKIGRIAALCGIMLHIVFLLDTSPSNEHWPWLVLALVTVFWLPSTDPFLGAVRRAVVALGVGIGAAIYIAWMFHRYGPIAWLRYWSTPPDWALLAHCLLWLWFGGTEAWEARTLYRATAGDKCERTGPEPPAESRA